MSGPGDRAPKTLSPGEPTYSYRAEGHGRVSKSVDTDSCLSTGSKSSARSHQASAREPGDLDVALPVMVSGEPAQEGNEPQAGAKIVEKSDKVIVPKKSAKTRVTPVEPMEGRSEAKGKSAARNASSTPSEHDALTFLQRIRERAKQLVSLSVDPRWEPGAGNLHAGFCPGGGPKGPSLPGRRVFRRATPARRPSVETRGSSARASRNA